MSTKTIYKRIALVAVAALGAGVLSVAPANAANNGVAGAAAAPAPLANVLNVATEASITGVATVVATVEDGTTTAGSFNESLGLLANSTTVDVNSLTSTATMRSDGEIVFYTKTDNDVAATFTVDGGTFGSVATESGAVSNINAARTSYVTGKATAATQIAFSVKPNAGATTMTVSMYKSGAMDTISQTKVNNVQSGVTSRGTLIQRYIVTVATTSVSGVYSSGDSFVQAQVTGGIAAPTTNVDATNSTTIANSASSVGFLSFDLRDAYNVSLSGKGALVVSATNGAGVSLVAANDGTYGEAASVTLLTAVSNFASGTVTVARPAAFANKGFSTTVTISWNGAVVGTKSFTFLGEVATMVVTPRRIAQMTGSSSDSLDAFRVTYADSAGNTLIGLGTTATTVVSTTTTTAVTGAAIGTQGTAVDAAKGTVTCAAATGTYFGGGTAKLQLQHVNSVSGTVVKSNVFDMTCQPNAYSYTASWDKASYTPGSLATLTITFRDRDGDLANGYDTVAFTDAITFAGTPSALPVAGSVTGSGSSADRPNSGTGLQGIKTFQFVVGAEEGDFQAVVGVPDVNARSGQANLAVAYKVAKTTAGTTNEDVLKAIVSLIASINKQIAALQKALLRR
jgi:trimeric autotransporter adhesin